MAPLALAAGLGILASRAAPVSPTLWQLAGLACLAAWLALWRRGHTNWAAVAVLAAAGCAGGGWHELRWRWFPADELARAADELRRPVCLEVEALGTSRFVPAAPTSPWDRLPPQAQTRLAVQALWVRDGAEWRPCSGRSELRIAGPPLFVEAGERLLVFAHFRRPSPQLNPGGFDAAAFDRTERRLVRLDCERPECIARTGAAPGWTPARLLGRIRGAGARSLHAHVPEASAPLAAALLLGAREELEDERTEAFFLTGSIHVLSISGLHVGILSLGMLLVLRRAAPPRAALAATALFVAGYALLVDAEPPVVRAAVLTVALCLAEGLGRRSPAGNTLAGAALAVLALNPAELFQTGTQLSFLAAAMLLLCRPWWRPRPSEDPLDRLLARARPWPLRLAAGTGSWLGRLALLNLVVWLAALPLVAHRFHLLSPAAPLLNLVIALPTALALYFGFLVMVLAPVAPPLAEVCGWGAGGCLWVLEQAVALAARSPTGPGWTCGPAGWWVVGTYVGAGVFVIWPQLRPPRRWFAAAAAVWLAAGVLGSHPERWPGREERPLACTVLAVGHGAAVLVELPDGRLLLYDAGRLGPAEPAARAIAEAVWARGASHLDAVVISHPDADHYNALPELLRRVSVGAVYVSPVMHFDDSPGLALVGESVARAGAPVAVLQAGDRLEAGPACRIEVLHPPPRGIIGSDNANSIVLSLEHAGRRLLLLGDLEPPGLQDVLAEEPHPCDVLLAPHHGSAGSDPQGLAEWARPQWVLVSGSAASDTGSVEAAYERSGAEVLHTAWDGALRAELSAEEVRVRAWRREPW